MTMKTKRIAKTRLIPIESVKPGTHVLHDGAYRKVDTAKDFDRYVRLTFSPAWGEKRVNKGQEVYEWYQS
jgi:hypothetical protein